jgi:ribosomal protein L37AE/L43A
MFHPMTTKNSNQAGERTQMKTTVQCGHNHGGNRTLTMGARGIWECNGCGGFFTQSQVETAEDQHFPGGVKVVGR